MRRNRAENDASHLKLTRRAALSWAGAHCSSWAGWRRGCGICRSIRPISSALLAEENRINIRLIPPARGEIFDRNGVRLAENIPSYRIVMVREDAG